MPCGHSFIPKLGQSLLKKLPGAGYKNVPGTSPTQLHKFIALTL